MPKELPVSGRQEESKKHPESLNAAPNSCSFSADRTGVMTKHTSHRARTNIIGVMAIST
jgi:hypothetical protein